MTVIYCRTSRTPLTIACTHNFIAAAKRVREMLNFFYISSVLSIRFVCALSGTSSHVLPVIVTISASPAR
ncbi:hypothetical protein Hypma_003075 [Hypsizygus marmoreus]|uniref:Uncharacterized protein n=1 Tax=Hypsizygus marmoreus TaxID=39966 RepID=A0A369J4K1_HYPMA|nr:hypothetical protein Hypma_003075 [Hypsizygus marmoreus]